MNIFGLSDKEVEESRKKYGSNDISKIKSESIFELFKESLGDPIIKILLVALIIKIVFLIKDFDIFETVGILLAILISSFISTISEYGSQKAFIKMQEEASIINCKVKRNNKIIELPINEIVKDDIVIVEQGDIIPADGYIIDGEITTDEKSLSGENKELVKVRVIKDIKEENKVYRGSVVTSKKAIIKATEVGNNTVYGKLSKELQEKAPDSPLKIRLKDLAMTISKIGYLSAFLVSFSYLFSKIIVDNNFNQELIINTLTNIPVITNYLLYALTLSVTIIVVAVPEGLPMMITLVLSKNMKKMIKENVLVRKMMGIETAGNINILFTDKTGTLTKGNLEVVEITLGNYKKFNTSLEIKNHIDFYNIFSNSIIYNSDCYRENNKVIGGNSADRALYSFINKSKDENIKIIKKKQFNSQNKYSSTLIDNKGKKCFFKGAKEIILNKCNYYYDENGIKKELKNIDELENYIEKIEKKGIRVICLAIGDDDLLNNLTLISIVSIKDEIREYSIEGLKEIEDAGISTIMITGDNQNTAIAIANDLNLLKNDDIVLTSNEFNEKSDEEIMSILNKIRILARALPSDKTRLIRIAQKMNKIVGMTGDGINDAPALKIANVGFSMGSGTEIAKEASDIVIIDNNIKSIANAVLYGRTIFKSIRKFIICQLTINYCAIGLSLIGTFIGIDTPVTILQMLWINMVMDTLTGLAFAYEAPLKEYMKEQPKEINEPIINKYMISEILITGTYSFLLCIFFLKSNNILSLYRNNYNYLMSAFFGLFIFIDIFNSFNARTERINIISNITKNKCFIFILLFIAITQIFIIYYGGNTFRTIGLNAKELNIMIILASTVIPIDMLRKIVLKKNK